MNRSSLRMKQVSKAYFYHLMNADIVKRTVCDAWSRHTSDNPDIADILEDNNAILEDNNAAAYEQYL